MAEEQQNFSGISKEERREIQELYEKGDVEALREYFGRRVNGWRKIPLNIGITGGTGTGKSSFINTMRGLKANSREAAKVGTRETTTEPTPYPHPENQLIKFWDLPGVGTPNFTRDKYLERISFNEYDFFLIITCGRFTENDKWLAQEVDERRKKFFFVRTKIHTDMENDRDDHPDTHTIEDALNEIRNDIRENLGNLYDDRKVFLIDNKKPMMYDFDKLHQRISDDLPTFQREAFVLSTNILSEETVKRKVTILRNKIPDICRWIAYTAAGKTAIKTVAVGATGIGGAAIRALHIAVKAPLIAMEFLVAGAHLETKEEYFDAGYDVDDFPEFKFHFWNDMLEKNRAIKDDVAEIMRNISDHIGGDETFILEQNKNYFKNLGLDDESLDRTAEIMRCDATFLHNIVAQHRDQLLTIEGIQQIIGDIPRSTAEQVTSRIPILNSITAGKTSSTTIPMSLNKILTIMEGIAISVLRAAVENGDLN